MNKKYFKLFASCIPVEGSLRSGICDLQNSKFKTIPRTMSLIIGEYKNTSYQGIIDIFGKENKLIIDDYFTWLIKENYGFWCDEYEINNFPDMDLVWDSPHLITNAIIDLKSIKKIDYSQIIIQLKELAVPHIQIRAFTNIDFSFYISLLKLCEESRIKTIDIITPFIPNNQIKLSDLIVEGKRQLRVNSIIIYNADFDKTLTADDSITKIFYTKQNIESSDCCGKISSDYFSVNISTFMESQHYNTCLNRKISIDVNGEIKNCPSMQKSYGNIKDTTLKEALNKQGFKAVWNIKKDDIKICQDCEYRHVCTDCRAFIKDPNDIYSHPTKCTYNPYQGKWKGEKEYIPVTEMSASKIEEIRLEYS